MNFNKKNLILVFILILGFYYRLKPFLQKGMWLDEACIFEITHLPLRNIIFFGDGHWDMAHPQLFYLFIYFWQKISTNLQFLRIPSLILGTGSIVLIYLIGRLIGKTTFALLSALIFSLSTWFINLSWQMKTYNLDIFLIFLSIYFLLRFILFRNNRDLIITLIANIFAFYTDYASGWYFLSLIITGLILFQELKRTNLLKKYYLMLLGTFIAMIPQFFLIFFNLSKLLKLQSVSVTYINTAITADIIFFAIKLHSGLWLNSNMTVKIVLFFSIISLFLLQKKKRRLKFFFTLILTSFFAPLIVCTLISLFFPIFAPRFLLISSLIFVFGLPSTIFFKNKSIKLFSLVMYCYFIFLLINNQKIVVYDGFLRNKEIRNEIEKRSDNGRLKSVLVSIGKMGYVIEPLRSYYLKGHDRQNIVVKNYQIIEIKKYEDIKNLPITKNKKQNYWLIYHKNEFPKGSPIIKNIEIEIDCSANLCFEAAILE